MANKLYEDGIIGYPPVIGFYDREGLRKLAASADLAVHCAYVEVEGMSITEALGQAVVPVIAIAPNSGTATYALDERSTFPAKDHKALARKIDYWLEHPQERWEMGFKYARSMEAIRIDRCVPALIDMFRNAINHSFQSFCRPLSEASRSNVGGKCCALPVMHPYCTLLTITLYLL
jgi:glycosyltransferase involved in cell wall biosynthesis